MNSLLHGLEPASVLAYFEDMTKIPHASGKEAALADYIENFAKKRSLFFHRDKNNNILVRKAASPSYESHPAVILQGHLDMVCEKNAGVIHDFDKDPLDLRLDGDILSANGTTLGADDGVACAIMLAILADESLHHPTLECLFTTEEETGLDGMRAFDASILLGRTMINIDSTGEGEATVSCAGGCRTDLLKDLFYQEDTASALTVSVRGLSGGHSGENINDGRMNAIILAVRLLAAAAGTAPVRFVALSGGEKDNAIPRECTVSFTTPETEKAVQAIRREWEIIQNELIAPDSGADMTLKTTENTASLSSEDSATIIRFLRALPNGVAEMNSQIQGMPETSSNLGIARVKSGRLHLTISSRSAVDSKLTEMLARIEAIGLLAGASVSHRSRYPGWKFRTGSKLQQLYLETYHELTGEEARLIGIHAGLECGLMAEKCPDMDMISIGANVWNIHSPDERLFISSLARTYKLILRMLEKS